MGSPKSVTLGPGVVVSDPNSVYKSTIWLLVHSEQRSLDVSHPLPPYPSFTFFSFTFCYTMPPRPRPLHLFQIIPNINKLDDFGEQDPPAISGLTSPTEPVTKGVVSSSPFSLSVLVLIVVSYYIIYIFLVLIVVSYYIIYILLFLFSFLFQTFKVFLNHYVDRSTIFETSLSNDEVIGFSTAGKKLYRNLTDILITFSEKGNYAGDFMGRIRMYEDWNVSYPYPA